MTRVSLKTGSADVISACGTAAKEMNTPETSGLQLDPQGRVPRVWRMIHSLFTGRSVQPSRIPLVALVASEQDRRLLAQASDLVQLEVHFVESCEKACALAVKLTAPVILLDRDWPETDWRIMVQNLAASPHQACVVLMSGVADDYLWQELVRRGGYDIVIKPLRPEDVTRVVKLALSYWISVTKRGRELCG
jgi:response regulator RpfG family c-di-GMP phosphodiesterase